MERMEKLRTEAEKVLRQKVSYYGVHEEKELNDIIDAMLDFHAQQSKTDADKIIILENQLRVQKGIVSRLKQKYNHQENEIEPLFLLTNSNSETAIKESQQSKEREWISVSEKYPDEKQTVWCYSEKLDNVFLGEYVYVMNEGWFWAESNGVIYASDGKIVTECEMDDFDVSHWFPTPLLPNKSTLTK